MNKLKEKLWPFVPREMVIPLLLIVAWNMTCYYGSKALAANSYHYNIELAIDGRIPFLPWTIIIYFTCYAVWIINYMLACRQSREEAWTFVCAEMLGKAVSMAFFVFLPTTLTRPDVTGGDIWSCLIRFLYGVDTPVNLFPSVHCLASWFCWIGVRNNKKIPTWYKWFTLIDALLVCVSTVTTKQHVFIDMFGGVAIAELSYQLVKRTGIYRPFRRAVTRVFRIRTEE